MFLTLETKAIVDKQKGDTLSETLRKIFSTKDKGKLWKLRRALFIIIWIPFAIWFGPHIMDKFGW